MNKSVYRVFLIVTLWLGQSVSHWAHAGVFSGHPKAQAFVDLMVSKHGFDRAFLEETLAKAEKKQAILDAIARPAEKTKPWYEYRQIFLGQDRIDQGVAFWQENQAALDKASTQYGVEPAIIVAIIGVETRYGRHKGSYRVIDALTTLGFEYPPRGDFFTRELEQFFLLVKEQKQNPLTLVGSYAGAMGFGQFISSSYRRYARDGDGDGLVDIWENKVDAIASVAAYFKAHGWQTGQQVMVKAAVKTQFDETILNPTYRPKLTVSTLADKGYVAQTKLPATEEAIALSYRQAEGTEYWLGLNNFYVITRYNRSKLYARAVWELSEAIEAKKLGGPQ